MAQAQPALTPRDHLAKSLGQARIVAKHAVVYVALLPFWPSTKKLRSSRLDHAIGKESEAEESVDTRGRPSTTCVGYLSLPPEIRLQILEEVLAPGVVYPHRSLTTCQRRQQDCQIMTTAQRQAWKSFIRHPSSIRLSAIGYVSDAYHIVLLSTTNGQPIINVAPHFLSTCRTAYDEGHGLFYSKNTFIMARGPLSNSKDYYDRLQPQHKRMIRHMVLGLHITDLTLEAFDSIESQLRAQDVVRGRLPPDDSVEDWGPPVVYNLLSIWRSKLAWLQTWTWLENLEIYSVIGRGNQSLSQRDLSPRVSHFRIKGKDLPEFLRGIGPAGPHCPVMNCYKECNSIFAKTMHSQEKLMWNVCTWMIERFGWKGTKARIRRLAYKEANAALTYARWI